MKSSSSRALAVALAAISVAAQSPFTTFNQTKKLPTGCVDGYTAGSDTVLYTVPYTYTQVLSVIGSFKNLTWSGNPDDTVTLNGTDNTVGTARTYESNGAHVIETLTLYMKTAKGPYAEIHTLAPLTIPSLNLSFYADYDANFVSPTCNGSATLFNETVNFCATNATQAAAVLHTLHLTDASTVGKLLGGQNFTSCAALSNSTSSNSTSSNATSTSSVASSTTIASPTASSSGSSGSVTTTGASTSPTSVKGSASSLAGSALLAGLMALGAVFL